MKTPRHIYIDNFFNKNDFNKIIILNNIVIQKTKADEDLINLLCLEN
ncbi:hypothetical protein ABXT57_02880 [Methylophilaceae bacterium Uisw_097]